MGESVQPPLLAAGTFNGGYYFFTLPVATRYGSEYFPKGGARQ
jgi:hypothetical protein